MRGPHSRPECLPAWAQKPQDGIESLLNRRLALVAQRIPPWGCRHYILLHSSVPNVRRYPAGCTPEASVRRHFHVSSSHLFRCPEPSALSVIFFTLAPSPPEMTAQNGARQKTNIYSGVSYVEGAPITTKKKAEGGPVGPSKTQEEPKSLSNIRKSRKRQKPPKTKLISKGQRAKYL